MSRFKKEILNKLKEYAGKMGRDHLGGDDYTSKKRGGLRDFDGYDNVDYNKDMPMDEGKYYITRNLGRGQGKSLVKHYDKKKKQSTKPKEFKSYKDAQKEIDKLKRGGSMGGQMTAYIITDKKMNRLNEAKDMTLSDYLKILDKKIEDAQKAVTGKNGSKEEYSNRGDILQNFKLFRNYISSMDKRHKGNKTKLRFISENFDNLVEACWKGYKAVGGKMKNGKQVPNCVPESVVQEAKVETERYFGKKGIIIMIRDGNKMISAIFKDKKNADKFNRNNSADVKKLVQLAKKTKYPKAIDESIDESMFSTIDQIRQDSKDVRDFVKNVFKDRDFKKMSNDKDFIKYLKSIYEGVNEAIPQNFHQGRTSDYHTALRGKNKDYSGGTNFKKNNHGQPDVEEDDEDQETNHLSNKQTHIKSPLKVSESGKKKSDKNYKDWKSSRLRKEISKKLKEYASKLTLSYIADKDSKLDGTPEDINAIDEKAERDYKDEYKKFQSSKKSKKYRAELNKYNRQKGTYGNGDGKDASHKGGKIVGFESASKNRGRAEKSRLKKESVNEAKLNHHRITGNSIEFYVKDKGKNLVLRFKDKRDFDKLKLDLDNPKDLQKILAKRPNKMSISMGESVVNEIGQFPINNYIQGIIPTGYLDTNTPQKKKQSVKLVSDLKKTLNTFWKQHDIPYRIK